MSQADPVTTKFRLLIAIRRHWGIVTLMAAIAVGGWMAWSRWAPRQVKARSVKLVPRVNRLAFSPERGTKYVAAAMSDGRMRLWETATQREIPVKLLSEWPLNDLAWSSDASLIFVGGFEEHVLTWNVKAARSAVLPKFPAPVVSIAVRPRRPELLVSLSNGELWWLNFAESLRELITSGHKGVVKVVRYQPDGTAFITGGVDQQLVWHDAESRAVAQFVDAHQHEISSLAFSTDGKRLVSGSWDNTAKVWALKSKEPAARLVHPDGVAHVAWRGDEVVTTCWDGRLRIWNATTSEITTERDCQSDSLAFDFLPGKSTIAEVAQSGSLSLKSP